MKCCIKGCFSYVEKDKHLSFHRFPRDRGRIKEWAEACGLHEDFVKNGPKSFKNRRVCSLHFESYCYYGRNRLAEDAVPTVVEILENNISEEQTMPTEAEPSHKSMLSHDNMSKSREVSIEYESLDYKLESCKPSQEISECFNCEESVLKNYTCKTCNFNTSLYIILFQHMKGNHCFLLSQIPLYQCGKCNFKTYSFLCWFKHEHNEYFSPDGVWFKCEKCTYKTRNQDNFTEHQNHECNKLVRFFKCPHCPHKTRHKHNLKNHINAMHVSPETTKWFSCEYCGFKSKHFSSVLKHKRFQHPQPKVKNEKYNIQKNESGFFQCPHCPHKSKERGKLKCHISAKHLPPEEGDWFYCDHCPYRTRHISCINLHKRTRHNVLRLQKSLNVNNIFFECPYCTHKTKDKIRLSFHVGAKHLSPEEGKWFHCDQCSYRTRHSSSISKHRRNKHAEAMKTPESPFKRSKAGEEIKIEPYDAEGDDGTVYSCPYCSHKSKWKTNLDCHVKTQHLSNEDVKWFHCDKCRFKSKYRHSLKKHRKTHAEDLDETDFI